MPHTYSQHNNAHPLLRTLRQIFIPDWLQLAISLLVAAIVYGIVSGRHYWDMLAGDNVELKTYSSEMFQDSFSQLSQLPGASTVAVAFIWGVVGIGVYILVLLAMNLFITTQNNKTVNSEFQNKPKLLLQMRFDQYRRLLWVLLFVSVMWLSIVRLLPFWLSCFYIFNNFGHPPQFFVLGLLGLAYNLYLLFACSAAVWRNPQVLHSV